jgi:hypothetical protein
VVRSRGKWFCGAEVVLTEQETAPSIRLTFPLSPLSWDPSTQEVPKVAQMRAPINTQRELKMGFFRAGKRKKKGGVARVIVDV